MKKLLILIPFVAAFVMSCNSPKKEEVKPAISFDSLLDAYHEERLKLSPLEATAAGDNRYNDQLPNTLTIAYRNQVGEFYGRYKNIMATIDRNSLVGEQKISYDVLSWECNINLEGLQFKDYLMPINQMFAPHLMMG